MLLWVIFALLTAIVLAIALRPLFDAASTTGATAAEPAVDDRSAHDVTVYRAQLRELDDDLVRGTLSHNEAEAARIELSRRLLKAADTKPPVAVAIPAERRRWLTGAAALAVPLMALPLYISFGQPVVTLPAARVSDPTTQELILLVEARLKANPTDGRGWDVIAPIYRRLGRYAEAAEAFAKATSLLGDTPQRAEGEAQSLILAADGIVTPAAEAVLNRSLKLDAQSVLTRFWLAVAAEQQGRKDEARGAYNGLLANAPTGSQLRQMLNERLAILDGKPAPPAATPGPVATTEKGPTAADVEQAAAMSDGDRSAMIAGMVAGLAQRLATNGRDAAGWQKLIRAYVVLQQRDKALAALGSARTALAGDDAALSALATMAKEAGLEP
jgi:cytochrome c-type biogenesis protein CcmH